MHTTPTPRRKAMQVMQRRWRTVLEFNRVGTAPWDAVSAVGEGGGRIGVRGGSVGGKVGVVESPGGAGEKRNCG